MDPQLQSLRERPFDLLLALEQRLQKARLDIGAGVTQLWTGLGFRLGEHWLAAPREDVREVIVPPPLTRVPGARPWLLGVANVRGSLLPVCDLHRLLGEEHNALERGARVMVFNSDRVPAGFLVDEVAGYRQFAPGEQRHDLVRDTGTLEPWLLGGFHRDGRDWLVISLRKLARGDIFVHAGA